MVNSFNGETDRDRRPTSDGGTVDGGCDAHGSINQIRSGQNDINHDVGSDNQFQLHQNSYGNSKKHYNNRNSSWRFGADPKYSDYLRRVEPNTYGNGQIEGHMNQFRHGPSLTEGVLQRHKGNVDGVPIKKI